MVQSFMESACEDGCELSTYEAPRRSAAIAPCGLDAIGEGGLHIVSPAVAELGREGEER
jgi:hypothetical protein